MVKLFLPQLKPPNLRPHLVVASEQCDQIGRFLKVLGGMVSTKSSQKHGTFLGIS